MVDHTICFEKILPFHLRNFMKTGNDCRGKARVNIWRAVFRFKDAYNCSSRNRKVFQQYELEQRLQCPEFPDIQSGHLLDSGDVLPESFFFELEPCRVQEAICDLVSARSNLSLLWLRLQARQIP